MSAQEGTDSLRTPVDTVVEPDAADIRASLNFDTAFFGNPRGLMYLAATEAWERFSFYGMQALLVLYLVDSLLLPEHEARVIGLGELRSAIEAFRGPLSTQAFASTLFGLYGGFVYLTPIFGGFVGDRLLGKRRAVMLGAILMSAGHILMAFDASFVLALVLLVLGCGCLKGNISAQVGTLFEPSDPRRAGAFAIYNVGINIGGLAGIGICGAVGEIYGWHYGFAVAGATMLLGLITYSAGLPHLPAEKLREPIATGRVVRLQPLEWRSIGALLVMLFVGMFFSTAYYQSTNVYLLWVRDVVDRRVGGWTLPVPWFATIDSLFIIGGTPLLIAFWRRQAARGHEPNDLAKIGIGSALVCVAYLLLAIAAKEQSSVSILWAIAFSLIMGIGFVYQWPTTLALVSRVAPPAVNSTMMGIGFITLFVAYNVLGWLGSYYETLTHSAFFVVQAAVSATGAVLVLLTSRWLSPLLAKGMT